MSTVSDGQPADCLSCSGVVGGSLAVKSEALTIYRMNVVFAETNYQHLILNCQSGGCVSVCVEPPQPLLWTMALQFFFFFLNSEFSYRWNSHFVYGRLVSLCLSNVSLGSFYASQSQQKRKKLTFFH